MEGGASHSSSSSSSDATPDKSTSKLVVYPAHLRPTVRAQKLDDSGVPGIKLAIASLVAGDDDSMVELRDWAKMHCSCHWVISTAQLKHLFLSCTDIRPLLVHQDPSNEEFSALKFISVMRETDDGVCALVAMTEKVFAGGSSTRT